LIWAIVLDLHSFCLFEKSCCLNSNGCCLTVMYNIAIFPVESIYFHVLFFQYNITIFQYTITISSIIIKIHVKSSYTNSTKIKAELHFMIISILLSQTSYRRSDNNGKGAKTQICTAVKNVNWQTKWNTRIDNSFLSVLWNNRKTE